MVFSWYIVGYLFVAGVASGAFLVSFGACLWDRWRQSKASERAVAAVQLGFCIAPVWSFAAIALLLLDLGNPERLLSLVMSPFDSVIGAGAWLRRRAGARRPARCHLGLRKMGGLLGD